MDLTSSTIMILVIKFGWNQCSASSSSDLPQPEFLFEKAINIFEFSKEVQKIAYENGENQEEAKEIFIQTTKPYGKMNHISANTYLKVDKCVLKNNSIDDSYIVSGPKSYRICNFVIADPEFDDDLFLYILKYKKAIIL